MSRPDPRLDAHWRTTRKSKSNPDLLTHADLYDSERSRAAGRAIYASPIVTVASVSIGLVKSAERPNGEEMVFLHFGGRKKKLGMNTTNSKAIERLTGRSAPSQWVGTTIRLYVDPEAKYPKGEKGPAIRIDPKRPNGAADATPFPEVPEADRERLEDEHADRVDRTFGDDEREPGEEG